MTVKQPVSDSSKDQDNFGSDFRKSKEFSSPGLSMNSSGKLSGKKVSGGEIERILCGKSKLFVELETDQESTGSSEEMESPKSVAKTGNWMEKNIGYVHSQILRIREEDSHLGDDIGEGLSSKDKLAGHHVASHMNVVLFSRPILPASPLGGKTTMKTVH